MTLFKCTCEHKAHVDRDLTPNGNPGHKYGARYAASYMRVSATPFGHFIVCRDCADDCYEMFPQRPYESA